MNKFLPMLLGVLALAACSPSPDAPTDSESATPAQSSHIPTQADIDRFRAAGPEPVLQDIRPLDYWLHYKLMQATGMEQALGGEAQAVAALQAIGNAYERKLRGMQAEAPKMIPVAFTGEGMTSGVVGLGMGMGVGYMTGGLATSAASSMSDEQLAELRAKGPFKDDGQHGKVELSYDESGGVDQTMEFDVDEGGLTGKVKTRIRMEACPDPQGKVTVKIDVDSQMRVKGKAGTGGYVRAQFTYDRYLDDDAHLISTNDGGASKMDIQMGGFENYQGQHVNITTGHERGGKPFVQSNSETGFSIFRPSEVSRTNDLINGAERTMSLIAEMMLRGIGSANAPWESGRCVDLQVTSSPGKRKGVAPGTAFEVEAKPRAKSDGLPAGGTVTATLSGGASLQPDGKVRADAKYSYEAPGEKDKSASIAFEARSKRGVGRATAEFDTKQGAHRISGGQNDFQANHTVCALDTPFDIRSSAGLTMHMVPSGATGGAWTQSGNAGGVSWSGGGRYTLSLDDSGNGTLSASGTSIISTPLGRFSDAVEPTFSVSAAEDASCGGG